MGDHCQTHKARACQKCAGDAGVPEVTVAEKSPPMRDSDVIYMCIKRLEVVAQKMQRYEYDGDLERLMDEVGEWFAWLATFVNDREADPS